MSAVFRDSVRSSLAAFLSPSLVADIVKSGEVGATSPFPSEGLSADQISRIRRAYGGAYNLIFLASTAFAGVGVFAAVMLVFASRRKSAGHTDQSSSPVPENDVGLDDDSKGRM